MSELIGGYRLLTPFETAGSGSARWCIAARGLDRFFLKQFLSPVYPADERTMLGRKQRERCLAFEKRKQRLYSALSCVIGDTLVPVLDFFRFERHYYAVSEAAPDSHITAEGADMLNDMEKRGLLLDLALCLQRLHTQGIVHADLKPEHVLLIKRPGGYRARLIDLDSGFLANDPPQNEHDLEGDPVYLAPETFLRMIGQQASPGIKADTFAFGAMIHRIWTGSLPAFDTQRYTYLYEAALDGGSISLSPMLPPTIAEAVAAMLQSDPAMRPEDSDLVALFAAQPTGDVAAANEPARPLNGLSRFMKI